MTCKYKSMFVYVNVGLFYIHSSMNGGNLTSLFCIYIYLYIYRFKTASIVGLNLFCKKTRKFKSIPNKDLIQKVLRVKSMKYDQKWWGVFRLNSIERVFILMKSPSEEKYECEFSSMISEIFFCMLTKQHSHSSHIQFF